ncbi:MAG: ParA family protein [Pseudomonadota bacterium]
MALIVSFVSQKGGVGKSTLARALAVLLTQSGYKVRIADLDPQQETSMLWAQQRQLAKIEPAIDVRGYRQAADAIADSEDVDILLLDGPARATKDTQLIAAKSHVVVQPSSGSKDDLNPAAALFKILERNQIPNSRLVVALSRTSADSEEREGRAYFEAQGYRVLAGDIRTRRSYNAAMNEGGSILETVYDSLNDRSNVLLDDLVGVIANQIEQAEAAQETKS